MINTKEYNLFIKNKGENFMLRFRKTLIIFLLSIFMIVNIASICYATSIPVTEESLKEAFEKFVASQNNNQNYEISVEDKIITIKVDDKSYTLNYDLTDKPTFSYEVEVKQQMSYNEFKEKTEMLTLPIVGYLAVANIQGVDYEDSTAYMAINLLKTAFSGISSENANNQYIVISEEDGVEVDVTGSQKVIKESEFGNYVMEYVNALYGKNTSYSDSEDFNTFNWTMEKKDVTDTSCRLVSTITINLDSDFLQINGFAKKLEDSFNGNTNLTDKFQNNESAKDDTKKDTTSSSKFNNDDTKSKTIIPKAGTSKIILAISLIAILAVIFGMKNRKYKGIE